MADAKIGRALAAALHESLLTRLPFRVEFYEHYLQTNRLRTATIGMAPFLAALSFLRQEGTVYHAIMDDAGRHAAAWAFDGASIVTRHGARVLPRSGRLWLALRLSHHLAHDVTPQTTCRVKARRKGGRLRLEGSPFCEVRAHTQQPLCGFYASALSQFCTLLGVDAHVHSETCRAMGAASCEIMVTPTGHSSSALTESESGLRLGL